MREGKSVPTSAELRSSSCGVDRVPTARKARLLHHALLARARGGADPYRALLPLESGRGHLCGGCMLYGPHRGSGRQLRGTCFL